MKVTIQECSAEEEEEVIIRCRGIDERISRLLKALQSDQEKLTVFDGEKMHQVQLRDICYFEQLTIVCLPIWIQKCLKFIQSCMS